MASVMEKLKAIPQTLNQWFEQYEPTIRTVYRLAILVVAFQIVGSISRSQIPDAGSVAGGLAEISKSLESIKRAIIVK